jgi:hypothetical protein
MKQMNHLQSETKRCTSTAGKLPLDSKSMEYLTNPLALKISAETGAAEIARIFNTAFDPQIPAILGHSDGCEPSVESRNGNVCVDCAGKPHTIHYSGNCTSPGNTIPRDFFPANPCVQMWAKGDANVDGNDFLTLSRFVHALFIATNSFRHHHSSRIQ